MESKLTTKKNAMKNSSDPLFNQYSNIDFSDAKPVSQIPALAKLQAKQANKSRISLRVDSDVLATFKA